MTITVRLVGAPRRWLVAEVAPPAPPPVGRTFLIVFLANALATGTVVALAARRLSRPLRRLREAAERFGRGEPVEPLALEGPDEVRRAAGAFNEMRARLERLIRDRTIMLASLSHDLRTPITSLRLRAEFVEDEETRERIVETLDEMRAMTEETLAFARDDAVREPERALDLTALAETLVDDLRARGAEAELMEGPRVVASVRVNALRRALRNLTDNAVTYGGRVRVTVGAGEGGPEILIDDDGPGIAPDDRERVFTPFMRLEGSRSRETGGTGLGLAIARSLIRAQGGDIALEDAPSGGLRVRVTLPG
ncbi:MAG: ATP-binding protein [Pseudomonadota bacterium]